jgi:hypothetical protein
MVVNCDGTLQFRRDSQKCSLMSSFTGVGWSWTELVEKRALLV